MRCCCWWWWWRWYVYVPTPRHKNTSITIPPISHTSAPFPKKHTKHNQASASSPNTPSHLCSSSQKKKHTHTHTHTTNTGVRLKPKHALQLVEAGARSKGDLVAKIVDLVEHHVLDLGDAKTAMRVWMGVCNDG